MNMSMHMVMNRWAVLHELPVYPQHDKDLQLPAAEHGVALRQHVARATKDALAEGLGVERTDLTEAPNGVVAISGMRP